MSDPVLPVYTKLVADTAGIEALQRRLEDVAGNTKRAFDKNFQDINRVIDTALSSNRLTGGGLDIGTDAIRENVQALRMRATAAQEVTSALRQTAGAERTLIAAADAAAVEARNVYQAEKQRLQILELTQAELAKTTSATGAYVAAMGRGTTANQISMNSARASRQAYVQLGQQLQDVAIQAQLGTNPLIILTQQGSQAAFALSGLGGTAGKVARFLAGPWGAAVFGAVTVLGLLAPKLFETKAAMDAAKVGSDGLSSAQGVLGEMFDLASGKIEKQNDLLRINARLTAANLRAEALKEKFDSQKTLGSAGNLSFLSKYYSGGPDKVGGPGNIRQQREAYEASSKYIRGIVSRVKSGGLKAEDAFRITENFDFSALGVTREEFQQALVNSVSSAAKLQTADAIDKTLDTNKLDSMFRKPKSGGGKKKGGSDAAANKAARLQEFGEDTADKIARINDQFSDTPKAIERANQAMRTLDDLADDIQRKNPANADKLLAGINKAKGAIQDSLVRPFEDYMKAAREASAVDELRAQGREDEALAMADILRLQEQMGPLTDKQKNDILATVVAERQRAAVIRDTQAIMDGYVQSVQDLRQALEQTIANALKGRLSLKNIFNSIGNAYINNLSRSIVEKMFGDSLRGLEDQLYGGGKVREASEAISSALGVGESAVKRFADVVDKVNDRIAASNDNSPIKDPGSLVNPDGTPRFPTEGEIIVNGRRGASTSGGLMTPRQLLQESVGSLGKALKITLPEGVKKAIGGAFEGAAYGQMASGVLKSIGIKQSKLGSQIGGAIGGAIAGPIGSIVGGMLGGTIGGAFKSAKTGVATIGGTGGNLRVASITGNSSKFRDSAGGSADSAITTLEGIAEQLGGTLNASRGSVSIGIRNGSYRVDTTGQGITKKKRGAIDFGEDATAAIKAATMDLIKDGVIEGLRASTQRLLQGGKDLEAAVAKAAKFESVFTRLKAFTDPVGAAIDTVDKEFRSLKKIFDEAGASAAEYADLEALYQKERAKAVEEASSAMTSALRGLLDELKTGDNGRSLRDRLSAALATYNPLASDLQAGKQVDYDKFAEAARTVLDIQRQIDGSQSAYFSRLDEITNLTAKALSDQENVISIAAGRPSSIGSSSTTEPAYTPVVDALGNLNTNLSSLLGAVNQNLGTLIAATQAGGGSPSYNYIAAAKSF